MVGKVGVAISLFCLVVSLASLHTASVVAQSTPFDTYVPVGSMQVFLGDDNFIPSGWLNVDGQCISRSVYAELFAVVDVVWGTCDSGNGFNLPDMSGRLVMGEGDGLCCADRIVGSYGGSETKILSVSQLPVHNHPVTDPGHTHGIRIITGGSAGPNNALVVGQANVNTVPSVHVSNSAITGLTVGNSGSGAAVDIMPPFTVVNFIVWSGVDELPALIDVTVVVTFPTHTPTPTPSASATPLPVSAAVLSEATRDMVTEFDLWGVVVAVMLIGVVLVLVRYFRRAAK